MKHLLIIATLLQSISTFAQESVYIEGNIINPTADSVFIYQRIADGERSVNKLVKACGIDENGLFKMSLSIESGGQFSFHHGGESTTMLLEPNDNLHVYLNTSYFDETIEYSGIGSGRNNAVRTLYLVQENINNRLFEGVENGDTVALFSEFNNGYREYLKLVKDYNSSIEGFESFGNELIANSKSTEQQMKKYVAQQIEFSAKMKLLEGKQAIDFTGIDLNGNEVKLSDYKGKMVVVDFWATWCAPCRSEFPAYKELEAKYGEEISFVSVGAFCKEGDWRKMATDEGFKNNIFLSKKAESQIEDYEIYGIPRYMVIDENFILIDANAPRPTSGKLPSFWE